MRSLIPALAVLALGLSGCMPAGLYASRAVEHNRAIAAASDQIVLLNIVRAKYDRPIVYTQFNGVSENLVNEIGAGLSIPFGADAASFYAADLALSPTQSASLSTSTLADVDYYQGVMRPVRIGLLRYYLDNGWPPDLVFALAVEKLDISAAFYARVVTDSDRLCAAGHVPAACARIADPSRQRAALQPDRGRLTFVNDPRSPGLFDPFHDLVLRLIVLGITVDATPVKQSLRIPAGARMDASADGIAALIARGAEIARDKGGDYIVTLTTWVPALRLTRLTGPTVGVEGEAGAAAADMLASLRSPDSILFYLGAYVRDGGADAGVLVGDRFRPVFELGACGSGAIEVEFEGGCYAVGHDGDHVSMKVVAFLHQIFGLNKRAVEPPAPAQVLTVN